MIAAIRKYWRRGPDFAVYWRARWQVSMDQQRKLAEERIWSLQIILIARKKFSHIRSTGGVPFPEAQGGWNGRLALKLNKYFRRHHPNIYQLVDCLQKESTNTESPVRRADPGAASPPKRRKYRDLDTRLQRIRRRYREGDLITEQFLPAVSHVVHHYWGWVYDGPTPSQFRDL